LKQYVSLFCVGDDAQSIYGFRGADFRNVHDFPKRVPGSITLKLQDNYRSTQEILDVSNWLLTESKLNYEKKLAAVRGHGRLPQLHTFQNEWEEGRWIADDLLERRRNGADWRQHMVLVRSAYDARIIESALLAKDIPYIFIGGTKLLESAHVRDALSALRVIANSRDEIGWMRFLLLWNGVGEVTASRLVDRFLVEQTFDDCIQILANEGKLLGAATTVLYAIKDHRFDVAKAVTYAVNGMEEVLSAKYRNQDWDRRRKDFRLVERLADKHSSILAFIEEYTLDPVYVSKIDRVEFEDVVTVITIHSAKGTEREVCYVANVSPGAFPLKYAQGNEDEIEEERRVLYVALTRAKDELIVTRRLITPRGGYSVWAETKRQNTVPVLPDQGENRKSVLSRLRESQLRSKWNVVLVAVSERSGLKQQAALRAVRDIAIGENTIALAFGNNKFAKDSISDPETLAQVSTILTEFIGRQVVVDCQEGEQATLSSAADRVVRDERKGDVPDPLIEFAVTLPKSETDDQSKGGKVESYFLNALPDGLFDEHIHKHEGWTLPSGPAQGEESVAVGIVID
jgi:ATP-dependent exoDNAse (exonuclease V) beta subunit